MKNTLKFKTLFLCLPFSLLIACDDHGTESDDPNVGSSSSRSLSSAAVSSSSLSSSSGVLYSSNAASSSSDVENSPAKLFSTRTPQSTELKCERSGTKSFSQRDWICSFDYQEMHGYFYMQATPTKCVEYLSSTAEFKTDKAQLSLGGNLVNVEKAAYDWGGNHQNDFIDFTYNGQVFKYDHSSFGFGWRQCQPMDCMQVYAADGVTLVADGCTSQRTIPVVCRMANEDGSFDDFTDTFAKCHGDDS